MSLVARTSRLVTWKPLPPGARSPNLSLTADEGTWVRTHDFVGNLGVVLVFFGSLKDDATDAWLKAFNEQRKRFEELDVAIFGVSTHRTDALREYRASLGLQYFLLYDPLAVAARQFRCSSRALPAIKDNVVAIDEDGVVILAERGRADPRTVLEALARHKGADVPVVAEAPADDAVGTVRKPGQPVAKVKALECVAAEKMLNEKDSPYILLDVRTLPEFEADHVPGAIHIPVDEVPHRYQELGQTTHIVTICSTGGRSDAAAEFLTSIGCTEIYNVAEGMSSWTGARVTGGVQS